MPNPAATKNPAAALELPVLQAHTPRCGPVRKSKRSIWRAASLIAVHLAVLVHIAHWKITGSTITPVEPSESMQTLELGYLNAGFVLFAILILSTLILGRFFCGWACHVVAYQDLCAWILKKAGLKPRPFRSRLLVLVPLGAAFYMFLWPTLSRIWQGGAAPTLVAHFQTDSFWKTFPGFWMGLLTILVDGFLIVWFLGAKGFCTYGCPYGAIFGVMDRLAPGKIRVTDACEGCGHCTATCTSNVRVHEEVARFGMVVDPGCMKCMDCVNVCPKDALYFGIGKPSVALGAPKSKKAYDLSWGGEIALALVFAAAFYAFRGLYNAIPFLLALGLAAIAAFLALLFVRLLRSRDFRLQHLTLKSEGKFSPAGRGAAVFLPAFFAFAIHSGWIQFETKEGDRLLREAREIPAAERGPVLARSLERLNSADRFGLAESEELQVLLGWAYRNGNDLENSELHFRKALAIEPGLVAARMELATIALLRGDFGESEKQLREVLRVEPENLEAQKRLQFLKER